MTPHEKKQDERLAKLEQQNIVSRAALIREQSRNLALEKVLEETAKHVGKEVFFQTRNFHATLLVLRAEAERKILAALAVSDAPLVVSISRELQLLK